MNKDRLEAFSSAQTDIFLVVEVYDADRGIRYFYLTQIN